MPRDLRQEQRVSLGVYRGLCFGLVLHRDFPPDAYLEGATTRYDRLLRGSHGPRAVFNALERLCHAYGNEIAGVKQDFSIAESQLRDYQPRIGKPFTHEAFHGELTQLRDQLKTSLAGMPSNSSSDESPDPTTEAQLSTAELADQIKALKTAHTIDAAPERTAARRLDAEEPVTARIRRSSVEYLAEPNPSSGPRSAAATSTRWNSRHGAGPAGPTPAR
ncbi:hypothetical protein RAS2_00440 [Phycisphaerae bacterium RAS2]|nr:hypothetical protein RAS2_00440 [Phycisphaerae bacterium RAS2]